jgi:hypothetical protein
VKRQTTGKIQRDRRETRLSTMLGMNSTWTAHGSKLDLGGENAVSNRLNCSMSGAKVKSISMRYGIKQITTGLLLLSP